jgi:hypothetical protein
MKEYCDPKSRRALVYYYFDFNDIEKQSPSNLVSSLVAQLCSKAVNIPAQLKELYQRCNNGQQKASLYELKFMLADIANELDDVFIVIDALDECPITGERKELMEIITEIKAWPLSNIHLLTTSRQELDIEETLKPLLCGLSIPIQGLQVSLDIKSHIIHQLDVDSKLSQWSDDVKREIQDTLMAGANGM